MTLPAFLDTCVLYPAYLCDTLLRLADAEVYRHVLAAAILAGASVVITFNLRDFPDAAVKPHHLSPVHPDEFLLNQLEFYPAQTLNVLDQQAASYRREPTTIPGLLTRLERSGIPRFAAEVRRHLR